MRRRTRILPEASGRGCTRRPRSCRRPATRRPGRLPAGRRLYELLRPRFGTTMEARHVHLENSAGVFRRTAPDLCERSCLILTGRAELVSTALARDPTDRPAAAKAASVIERALDADVVRQMKKDGASTGGGTVILRGSNGTSASTRTTRLPQASGRRAGPRQAVSPSRRRD